MINEAPDICKKKIGGWQIRGFFDVEIVQKDICLYFIMTELIYKSLLFLICKSYDFVNS
jgi:hypothetical protein